MTYQIHFVILFFWYVEIIQSTTKGIHKAQILILLPKKAIIQIQTVVQISAHKVIEIHCIRFISSALKNQIVITQTTLLDCIKAEDINQNNIHFQVLSVLVLRSLSNVQPVKFLNQSFIKLIHKRKTTTQVAIIVKFLLLNSNKLISTSIRGNNNFLESHSKFIK
jgi:hypothetical protein